MKDLVLIQADDVRRLLPMKDCIDAMADAMSATSNGQVAIPPRIIAPLVDNTGFFGVMPGSSAKPAVYGAKVISLHPDNPERHNLPAIQGFVALFDHDNGVPLALVEGAEITAIRTAAASGLATRLLAREDATTLGILGCGVQARTHLEAVITERAIEEIRVWGRSKAKAVAFCEAMSEEFDRDVRATSLDQAGVERRHLHRHPCRRADPRPVDFWSRAHT